MVVEAAPRRGLCATARFPPRRILLRWSQRAGGDVFSLVSFGRRDLCAGAGSARRRRRPSRCVLFSGSASVSAVFPPAQLEGPGDCVGMNRPAAAVFSGSNDGDLRDAVDLEQGLWKVVGRSDLPVRLRQLELADLQSVEHGDDPGRHSPRSRLRRSTTGRKIGSQRCISYGASTDSGLLAARLLLLRRCCGSVGHGKRAMELMCARTSKDCYFFVFFARGLCAMFRGHLCLWVIPVCAT
jgi:hypothetical protein